jgi:hypothetical protein
VSRGAVKLALYKFLSGNAPINAESFRATAKLADATLKGEKQASRMISSIFNNTRFQMPATAAATRIIMDKMDEEVKKFQTDPTSFLKDPGNLGEMLPRYAQAMGSQTAKTLSYLNTVRPSEDKASPFDSKPAVSQVEKAQYERAMAIAEQPLTILSHIKDATINSKDVTAFKSMMPELYNKYSMEITGEILDTLNKGETIPYPLRMSLSRFLEQPLDFTMTKDALIAIQASTVPPQDSQPPQAQVRPPKRSMTSLTKLPGMSASPSQQREQRRQR